MLVDESSYPATLAQRPRRGSSIAGVAAGPAGDYPSPRATARASTWTCLLPPDARYHFFGRGEPPDWAQELLQLPGTAAIALIIGQSAQGPVELAEVEGCVGVNCPPGQAEALRDAGFRHVREFAVVPGLSDPRLFIPLDSRAVAASAFRLYAPVKLAARCRMAAARAAALLGSRAWYRDRVTIALRQRSHLEQALAELFPDDRIHLALASGSAPPALNRKITLAVLGRGGRRLAFAKLPGPLPISRAGIENSVRMLKALADLPAGECVPRLLFAGTLAGTYAEVTSPLGGHMPGIRFKPAHQQFLDSLRTGKSRQLGETEWVQSMLGRSRLPGRGPDLDGLLERLLPSLSGMTLATTIVHGDFAPWNLRLDRGRIHALDWETGSLEGPPLIDRTHYLLSVGYLVRHWTVKQALEHLVLFARSAPEGLDSTTVLTLQATYLLDYLLRLCAEGYGESDARRSWCRQLALQLCALIPPAQGPGTN